MYEGIFHIKIEKDYLAGGIQIQDSTERESETRKSSDRHFTYWLATGGVNFIGRIPSHIVRNGFYRKAFKMRLPKTSIVYGSCRFFAPWKIQIGDNSVIGDHCFLDGRSGLEIGNNVNISGYVHIYTLEHDISSPTFGGTGGPVFIRDQTYIATRATILPGVTIGEGAVVACGAVVTKNVEAWTMVGGVPAKFIKRRPEVRYRLDTDDRGLFI